MHGIGLRQYLQDQQHVYLTSEDAEALTAGLMATFPAFAVEESRSEFHNPFIRSEVSFPLNIKYIKPILTRVWNQAKIRAIKRQNWIKKNNGPIPYYLDRSGYTPATQAKHNRAEESMNMYDEINRLRAENDFLRRRIPHD